LFFETALATVKETQKSSEKLIESLSGSFFSVLIKQVLISSKFLSPYRTSVFLLSSALFVYIDKLGKHASGM